MPHATFADAPPSPSTALPTLPRPLCMCPYVQLQRSRQVQDYHWLALLIKILERRLTQRLRFAQGSLYSVSVSPFFELEAPSAKECLRGDVAVSFTCAPGMGRALAEQCLAALDELQVRSPQLLWLDHAAIS